MASRIKDFFINSSLGIALNRKKYPVMQTNFFEYLSYEILRNLGFNALIGILISPSQDCPCNCVHCYESFNNRKLKERLSTEEIKDVIDQFVDMRGKNAVFCSGEFLFRQDSLDIIKYCSKKKLNSFIVTSGAFAGESKIIELKKAGLFSLIVSIDSANCKVHDKLRGRKGCFREAVNTIKLAKKHGLATHIWTYVSRGNAEALEGINELAKELGVYAYCYFPLLSGKMFNKPDEELSLEEKESIRKKFNGTNIILEFQHKSVLCTGGGEHHINVNPAGEVTICSPVPYSYGNIKNEPLKIIFKRLRKDFKRFRNIRGVCPVNISEYRNSCNAKLVVDAESKL